MTKPLDGIRVIDLSLGPAGGMATMIMADYGADVIKVEPPGGDPFRAMPHSPVWLRGKRSVIHDLATTEGRAAVHSLASGSDVVVTTLSEAQADECGIGYSSLSASNPGLVYARITGFGPKGPYANYPGYEGLVAAKSGRMKAFGGIPDRSGPAFAAVQVGTHAAAQSALTGVLGALLERDTSGRGQVVETSLLQAMMPYDLAALVRTQLMAKDPNLFLNDPFAQMMTNRMPTLNYHPVQAKDGRWLQLGNLLQHLFDNFLGAADLADIYADPRYEGSPPTWTPEDREAFRDRMLTRMRELTTEEWMKIFVENGGVVATDYRPAEAALDDHDLIDNGHVLEQDHPRLGRLRGVGPLATLEETPAEPGGPSHEAGADQTTVATRAVPSLHGSGSTSAPLAGVTVLEFATIIAAPLGVSFLGDLGARVIKVEPVGGDPYRGMGILGIQAARTNQSKESIALDLKTQEAREIVSKLAARTDIVIHNYRPGVPERLGIGYEDCKRVQPSIVYVSVNGYGPKGPGAHRPSTHPIPGAALGGALMQVGKGRPPGFCDTLEEVRAASEKLMRANEANPDPNTSMVVASSALLGLTSARRFGVGQQVFIDMLGANAYANADGFLDYAGKPPRAVPDHDLLGLSATYRLYQAASDTWVFLAVPTDAEFAKFAEMAGAPGLAKDARFSTTSTRKASDEALAGELCSLFATRDADSWESDLAAKGVGCVRADGPLPGDFWATDAHVRENGFVVSVPHLRYGDYLRWGTMVNYSRSPMTPGPACLAGDHTEVILAELGYSGADIGGLRSRGIAWSEPIEAI